MELIREYFPKLSDKDLELLMQYAALLKEWNQKINLISRKEEDKIVAHHILHSLSISKLIQFQPNAHILDLGTGGGLPGIPLAILYPHSQFHLVDSIGKKVRAVHQMAKALQLKNTKVQQCRVENLTTTYDFIITRAVAKTEKLLGWTKGRYKKEQLHDLPNGLLALKGGDLTEELVSIRYDYEVIPLSTFFDDEFYNTKKLLYVRQ